MARAGAFELSRAVRALERTPGILVGLTADLTAAGWRTEPAPARWSPLEILCHLRDEEEEDFGARVRVVLAGGGVFAPIRPVEWVAERRYRAADPKVALADFQRRRATSLELLQGVKSEQLWGVGRPASGTFELTGEDVVAAWVAHDLLHLRQLTGTLARLWADAHAHLRVDYAGDLPYPPPPAGAQSSG
jgi:hypothetical protein